MVMFGLLQQCARLQRDIAGKKKRERVSCLERKNEGELGRVTAKTRVVRHVYINPEIQYCKQRQTFPPGDTGAGRRHTSEGAR